jgi:hypothetical protein
MLPLVQVCISLATLAVILIAVAAVRAMFCVERATHRLTLLSAEIHQWIGQANQFMGEARETMASARGAITPIRRVVERFESIGERTANLSAAVLGEIETPIHTAVAVARGVKSVTAFLLERWSNRITHGRSATNGGSGNE